MKEFLVISGKGGTGKTSITAAFAALASNIVIADCDVDAANLHMLLQTLTNQTEDFIGSQKAIIDPERCTNCGICEDRCRFGAIEGTGTHRVVDSMSCEGCGVCHLVCPEDTITLREHVSGQWLLSDTRYGPLVHAQLGIAEENSGKLVAKVRGEAQRIAAKESAEYILIDGPPGTGCPVISSISGVDLALIVTEPTVAGLHDLARVSQLADHFGVPAMVCINKFDLDETHTDKIESYCHQHGVEVAGRIPFDKQVVYALIKGLPAVDDHADSRTTSESSASKAIQGVWQTVLHRLEALPS